MSNTKSKTTSDLENYKTLDQRYAEQQARINNNYNNQVSNLDFSKMNRQQQADITKSQLQKYLPFYYKSKGLSGLGLEQSAMLEANANYTNQLGQIESDYLKQKTDLENYRDTELTQAENTYLDKIDEQKSTNSLSAYNEVADVIEGYRDDNKLSTDEYEQAQDILNLYRDSMTPSDVKAVENLLKNYNIRYGEKTDGTTQAETIGDVSQNQLEGKSYIDYNGEKFVTDKKINKADKKIVKNNNYVEKVMEMNGFASAYDEKIPDGFVLVAYEDADGNNKNTYEIRDGKVVMTKEHKAFGTNNSDYYGILAKKYYVYKNGQWYQMEKR